jgi:hypothetical protein
LAEIDEAPLSRTSKKDIGPRDFKLKMFLKDYGMVPYDKDLTINKSPLNDPIKALRRGGAIIPQKELIESIKRAERRKL